MLQRSYKRIEDFSDIYHDGRHQKQSRRQIHLGAAIIVTLLVLSILKFGVTGGERALIGANLGRTSPFRCPDYLSCKLRASAISPLDLMNHYSSAASSTDGSIPRLIHQSWGSKPLTPLAISLSETWRVNHPDWNWIYWSNEDNRKLVEKFYPWFLSAYDAFDHPIKRADAVRNLYMHQFGGIYVDFDLESVKPIDALLQEGMRNDTSTQFEGHDNITSSQIHAKAEHAVRDKFAFFGRMGLDRGFGDSIPNDFMAGSKGHPFFLLPILSILGRGADSSKPIRPEDVTGPAALRKSILQFESMYPSRAQELFSPGTQFNLDMQKDNLHLRVFNESTIHPLNWVMRGDDLQQKYCFAQNPTFDPMLCKEQVKPLQLNSYAIAYWAHSWA